MFLAPQLKTYTIQAEDECLLVHVYISADRQLKPNAFTQLKGINRLYRVSARSQWSMNIPRLFGDFLTGLII